MHSQSLQDRTSASSRETPWSRGDARGDGVDIDSHSGGGSDRINAVETEALQVVPGRGAEV